LTVKSTNSSSGGRKHSSSKQNSGGAAAANSHRSVESVAGGDPLGFVLSAPKSVFMVESTELSTPLPHVALIAIGASGFLANFSSGRSFKEWRKEQVAVAFAASAGHPGQGVDEQDFFVQRGHG
jgi:hypothetical protein